MSGGIREASQGSGPVGGWDADGPGGLWKIKLLKVINMMWEDR